MTVKSVKHFINFISLSTLAHLQEPKQPVLWMINPPWAFTLGILRVHWFIDVHCVFLRLKSNFCDLMVVSACFRLFRHGAKASSPPRVQAAARLLSVRLSHLRVGMVPIRRGMRWPKRSQERSGIATCKPKTTWNDNKHAAVCFQCQCWQDVKKTSTNHWL